MFSCVFSLQQLKLFHAIEKGKRAKVIKGTKDRPSAKSLKRVVTPGSSSSLLTVVAKAVDCWTGLNTERN